ncbi:MAG: DUF1570 domain-containing protein [Candidatus Omnitrophica bacterium]|nr:DUF1570 domain-containing protein [Candidatus Omnitrophota bacterium]
MKKKNRIQILAFILSLLCFYFFVFSIRSPFKDLTYLIIYRHTAKEIRAELGGSAGSGHDINAFEISLRKLLPDFHIHRQFGMTVFTNTSIYNVKNTIHLIQKHFAVLEREFPGIFRDKDSVFNVVILETLDDYNTLTEKMAPYLVNTVGFYHDDLKTLFICHKPKVAPHTLIPQNTIRHEATHQWFYAQELHRGFMLDRFWLVEGLATYYEPAQTGGINRLRQQSISQHLQDGTLLPLEKLLTENGSLNFKDKEFTRLYYDQSWAFVYFMMKKHRASFLDYLQKIQDQPLRSFLSGDLSLLTQTLDMTNEELENTFMAFWKRY